MFAVRECADVAASPRERHPRSRRVVTSRRGQRKRTVRAGRRDVRNKVGPIEERGGKIDASETAAGAEHQEVVGDEDSFVVRIEAGLGGQDIICGMRDEDRVVASVECAVLLDEIEKVGLLLEVGRDIGIVANEMLIIELNVYDVADLSRERIQLTISMCGSGQRQREESTEQPRPQGMTVPEAMPDVSSG
jgi:hypothetical protein